VIEVVNFTKSLLQGAGVVVEWLAVTEPNLLTEYSRVDNMTATQKTAESKSPKMGVDARITGNLISDYAELETRHSYQVQ
jgi:hypothetical protein